MCDGYSLECRPNVAPHDRRGLARLLRYGTRPAFSQERLTLENDCVVYKLPKPFWTGQTHVILQPVEFLRRLAALIPAPRFHTIRYHGLFSAAAKDRAQACALAPPVNNADEAMEAASTHTRNGNSADDPDRDAPYRKRRRMAWDRLLRQVFAIDVLQCSCGGERKIIAVLTRNDSPNALRRYLDHLGEPSDPPPTAPARAPPQTEFEFGAPAPDIGSQADPTVGVDPIPDGDAHFADS